MYTLGPNITTYVAQKKIITMRIIYRIIFKEALNNLGEIHLGYSELP